MFSTHVVLGRRADYVTALRRTNETERERERKREKEGGEREREMERKHRETNCGKRRRVGGESGGTDNRGYRESSLAD